MTEKQICTKGNARTMEKNEVPLTEKRGEVTQWSERKASVTGEREKLNKRNLKIGRTKIEREEKKESRGRNIRKETLSNQGNSDFTFFFCEHDWK